MRALLQQQFSKTFTIPEKDFLEKEQVNKYIIDNKLDYYFIKFLTEEEIEKLRETTK